MDTGTSYPSVEWLGTRYTTLMPATETFGRLSIMESLNQPGYGPPRHIHKAEDETFYVLSGAVEFWQEGTTTHHGPGDVVFVERGRSHAFRVTGTAPARLLLVMTPGGFEGFFTEMANGGYRIPEDMAQVVAAGAKFNLDFTGPPLAVQPA